ncbi:MAG: hypothetical protein AAB431_02825 [Patescibacteria group bacterium]
MLYKTGSVVFSVLVLALSGVVAYGAYHCLFGQYVMPRIPRANFSVFFWMSMGMVLFFLWPMAVRMIDDAWGQSEKNMKIAGCAEAAGRAFFHAWVIVFATTTFVGLQSGRIFEGGPAYVVVTVIGAFLLIAANFARNGWKWTSHEDSFGRRLAVEVL